MSLIYPQNLNFKKKKFSQEDTYQIQFAPDGLNWQKVKTGKINKLWDDFNFNPDYRTQCYLNPSAKFRLINLDTGKIIGEITRENVENKEAFLKKAEKEDWEMTCDEYLNSRWLRNRPAIVKRYTRETGHRLLVQKALSEGKPVPGEVLAEYPDLVK